MAFSPFPRGPVSPKSRYTRLEHFRFVCIPGALGRATAGAFLFARIIGKIRQLHASRKIDLLEAHGTVPCGHAAMLISRELKLPYVVSIGSGDELLMQPAVGRTGKWIHRISQRVCSESRRVICATEHDREQLLQTIGRSSRTSVVYHGVDTDLFHPPTLSESQGSVILNVSRLEKVEGQDLLLRVMVNVIKEFPGIVLQIIGDGPEYSNLRRLARELKVSEDIQFIAPESKLEIAEAMRKCMLFVQPSRGVALGCTYLQAMSSGKAVIVARRDGIIEIVRQGLNGFLINPENEKQLELAISMLLRDSQRRENLGRVARDTILDQFSLQQQAENLMRIYIECST